MANSSNHTDEALRTIDQAYKDILIHAGKNLRIMARDGPGALVGAHSSIRAKTEDILAQYHNAVSVLEGEIVQAQSILLRDLERLQAARTPAPVPAPVPAPISVPFPLPPPPPPAAPAPMMELPSAAAHSHNLNTTTYPSNREPQTNAPFPDMGMGISLGMPSDIVDLTGGAEKKPSPRVQPGTVKQGARPANATNVKPSPRPMPRPTPPKVTPVPPPQIPRLPGSQGSTQPKPQLPAQPPRTTTTTTTTHPILPPQQHSAARAVRESAMDNMPGTSSPRPGNGASAGSGSGELNFTDMEFSLAPPPNETQGAPPAPMPEFDLATFVPQGGNTKNPTAVAGNATSSNVVQSNVNTNANANQTQNPRSNMDDLFNLGDSSGAGDNMFDLGGNEPPDSTFDDMMFFGGNNDSDMAQFDDAYFGI